MQFTGVRLSPSQLRTLGVIVRNAAQGRATILRDLARELGQGVQSLTWYYRNVLHLRKHGLVTFEPGQQGTIRPTCVLEIDPYYWYGRRHWRKYDP